ncbi:hypothetical protein KLEB273_gp122 [Bacillus phage vB_BauM_KLEB27-3]|nr:hypothetical protein KLEB273_gp122 [Bacillus phage vB_BauM_KLEB27-3]
MKYRKKPVVVEAIQYDLSKYYIHEIREFVGPSLKLDSSGNHYISTLEGNMSISPGDYIIRGIQNEFYPCKPDIFEQTYERADASSKQDDVTDLINEFVKELNLLSKSFDQDLSSIKSKYSAVLGKSNNLFNLK